MFSKRFAKNSSATLSTSKLLKSSLSFSGRTSTISGPDKPKPRSRMTGRSLFLIMELVFLRRIFGSDSVLVLPPYHILPETIPDPFQLWQAGEQFLKLQKLEEKAARLKRSSKKRKSSLPASHTSNDFPQGAKPTFGRQSSMPILKSIVSTFDTRAKSVQSPYGKAGDDAPRPTMSTQSLKNLFLNVFEQQDEEAQATSEIELDEPCISVSETGGTSLEFTNKSGQWPSPRTPSESSSPLSEHNDDKESLLMRMLVAKDHNPPADAFHWGPLKVAPCNPPALAPTWQDLRASARRGRRRSSHSDALSSFSFKGRRGSVVRSSNTAWFNSQRERRRSVELQKLIDLGLLDMETKLNMTKDYSALGGEAEGGGRGLLNYSTVNDQQSNALVRPHKDSLHPLAGRNAKPDHGCIPLPSLDSTCSTGPSTMSDVSSLSSLSSLSLSDSCSCSKVEAPTVSPATKTTKILGGGKTEKMQVASDTTATVCALMCDDKKLDSQPNSELNIKAPSSCAEGGGPISPISPLSPCVLRMTRNTAKRQLEKALYENHESAGGGRRPTG